MDTSAYTLQVSEHFHTLQMELFPYPLHLRISCIYLLKSPSKAFGKVRDKLWRWLGEPFVYDAEGDQSDWLLLARMLELKASY